jgi:hypothetical protein
LPSESPMSEATTIAITSSSIHAKVAGAGQ